MGARPMRRAVSLRSICISIDAKKAGSHRCETEVSKSERSSLPSGGDAGVPGFGLRGRPGDALHGLGWSVHTRACGFAGGCDRPFQCEQFRCPRRRQRHRTPLLQSWNVFGPREWHECLRPVEKHWAKLTEPLAPGRQLQEMINSWTDEATPFTMQLENVDLLGISMADVQVTLQKDEVLNDLVGTLKVLRVVPSTPSSRLTHGNLATLNVRRTRSRSSSRSGERPRRQTSAERGTGSILELRTRAPMSL
ncbi:unnamed protein product [Durusdinium trenchii]|uniref:Uncharacterized protein n=1 Tax=Durusdinium trenchii TaxID=1381693 RepID=A0ABP0P5T4_9DINO